MFQYNLRYFLRLYFPYNAVLEYLAQLCSAEQCDRTNECPITHVPISRGPESQCHSWIDLFLYISACSCMGVDFFQDSIDDGAYQFALYLWTLP